MNPIVSTLICTYNAKEFFGPTIRSVLEQVYDNQEVLIWDDCSTDGTVEILKERQKKDRRIKLFIETGVKRGAYGGLNYLLDNAKGKYIAIQDHDDIWHSEKLKKQVEFLEVNSEYEGCGVMMMYYYEFDKSFYLQKNERYVHHSGIMYRLTDKRYDLKYKVETDTYFIENILDNIFLIDLLGLIHRRRKGGKNLSIQWLKNIKEIKKGTIKSHLFCKQYLLGIILFILPSYCFDLISFLLRNIKEGKSIKKEYLKKKGFKELDYL